MKKLRLRIILSFIKKLIVGHFEFFVLKLKNGFTSYYCTDSLNGNSEGNGACYEQCFFCKTSTNTSRGLKFYDKKTNRFFKLGKWVD